MTEVDWQRALEEWLERALGGEEPDPESFARARGLAVGEFAQRIVAARWLVERERAEPGTGPTMPAPPAATAGKRFGRYEVLAELGRGGQAEVYLAHDTVLHRRVALKVLGSWSARAKQRFQREALVASRLEHPAICGVHDFGAEGDVPYIAMRLVDGETLARRIAHATEQGDVLRLAGATAGKQPAAAGWTWKGVVAVLAFVEEIARALDLAHQHGVIHRDVKPANVMVTPAGAPVLLDFGLASDPDAEHSVTGTSDLVGTPIYMSPEQLRSGRTDRRTDVYSLGAVLYECLTLTRPFTAPTRERLFQAIEREEPADPRRRNRAINADLRLVLTTAMQKEPRHRYATALDFAEDLARVRTAHPVRARPLTAVVVLSRWARRNPALAACLGALLFVLAAGLVLALALFAEQRAVVTEWRQLADLERAENLLDRSSRLWPTVPERLAGPDGFDAWLAEAGALARKVPEHTTALAKLRMRARPPRPGNATAAAERTTFEFADPEDGFRHQSLVELLRLLAVLDREQASVATRREMARNLDRLTIEEPAVAWAMAVEHARAPDGPYRGLALRPQRGLVPLGCDCSGLCEFAHVETGAVPVRDAERGELQRTAATGLVFVLLPGGRCTVGRRAPDAVRGRSDPPEEQVELEPFFLSKYEMTQSQWLAIMGENPSHYRPGMTPGGKPVDLRHPVETVSAVAAAELLRRLDLVLPTDAQWEYGCRAGTETKWYTGDDPESLQGHANIADEGSRRFYPEGFAFEPEFVDGYGATAPVGTYAANAFGLHDVHGNVMEWCRDGWRERPPAARSGDGLRQLPDGSARQQVFRGGRYFDRAAAVRSDWRGFGDPAQADHTLGLRPARVLAR